MINDIKLGIKIMRYGHGWMISIILGGLFLVLGIVIDILNMTSGAHGNIAGGFILLYTCLLPAQALFSVNASNMVLSSPVRKKMQTSIPAAITVGSMLALYIVADLILLIMSCIYPDRFPIASRMVVVQIVFAIFVIIYFSIAFKCFSISTIMFIICFVFFTRSNLLMGTSWIYTSAFFDKGIWSFVLVSVLGLPIIAAAGFLGYLLMLLVYKVPVSKYSQNAYLRKEM
ncbi:MAG: hypothetical protein K2N85_02505 [Lachnospiraceae bacterium]|nr:hypothetical protein [Lachnospiraceae bacterium]